MIRRSFLAQAPAAAMLAVETVPLPSAADFSKNEEAYWTKIRRDQFVLPEWRAYLNTGSVGSAPKPVLKATSEYMEKGASYAGNEYPRWGYEAMLPVREAIASFVGATAAEIALTHNATESMGIIANGLDLRAGDEVLITDQEHPSGRGPWLLKQARAGVRVRELKLPVPPKSASELSEAILSAIRPETKVLSFSGITTHTGLLLPVKEICAVARAKGVITVVDGAHMPGQVALNIADIGCDLFAASLHKWMLTPPGCGFLYVRREFQDRLWPTVVVDGWQNQKDALKYMQLGCNNRAELEGILAAIQFIRAIGVDRIQSRIHSLAQRAYGMAKQIPALRVLSAEDHRLYGGMIAFDAPGKDYTPLWRKLEERKVWTLRGEKIRVSCHIHTRPRDLETLFSTIRELWG